MRIASAITLQFGGQGSGCNPQAGHCGRPQGTGNGHDYLKNAGVFRDPAMKSFIVTPSGKAYGIQMEQGHDTLLIFHAPQFKHTVVNGKASRADEKFLAAGGIRAGVKADHAYIEIAKATEKTLKLMRQVIDHIQPRMSNGEEATIEIQIGKQYWTGTREQVRGAVSKVLQLIREKQGELV